MVCWLIVDRMSLLCVCICRYIYIYIYTGSVYGPNEKRGRSKSNNVLRWKMWGTLQMLFVSRALVADD